MPPAMNRLLLAILALFAGLAAQVSPAEARVRGETEIGATLAQRSTARSAAVAVAAAFRPIASLPLCRSEPRARAVFRIADAAPTVRLGVDRARE